MTHEPEWLAHLRASVNAITNTPLPSIPGADLELYDELRAIRLRGATTCCLMLLMMVSDRYGSEARAYARRQIEPLRLRLLREFPEHRDLLAGDTWPEPRRIH